MAIDGFGVLTRAPYQCEVERPKDYRCHKTGFAIIVLAGCDIHGCIISASCDHSGSMNDIIAFQVSNLFDALEIQKLLPEKYFIIGDEAFNTTQQVLSPWPGKFLISHCSPFGCFILSPSVMLIVRLWPRHL
jgi:hypothetical protein